jgi:hypothetical protein
MRLEMSFDAPKIRRLVFNWQLGEGARINLSREVKR